MAFGPLGTHAAVQAWRAIKLRDLASAWLHAQRRLGGLRPVFHDIGGRGGLQTKWRLLARAGAVRAVLFEPERAEAERLRRAGTPAQIVSKALGPTRGPATLHVTRLASLTSVREPNPEVFGRYGFAPNFEVVERVPLELETLAALIESGEVPAPHFAKIDVQGFEIEILEGFGRHLDGVVALELELQFEEVYRGQKLVGEAYAWLRERGFALAAIRPQSLLDDAIVEANAFFSRSPERLDAGGREMLGFWRRLHRIETSTQFTIRTG